MANPGAPSLFILALAGCAAPPAQQPATHLVAPEPTRYTPPEDSAAVDTAIDTATADAPSSPEPPPAAAPAPVEQQELFSWDTETTELPEWRKAVDAFGSARFEEARERFTALAEATTPRDRAAQLFVARSIRALEGCAAALPHYYRAFVDGPRNQFTLAAMTEAAFCHRQLGETSRATLLFRMVSEGSSA